MLLTHSRLFELVFFFVFLHFLGIHEVSDDERLQEIPISVEQRHEEDKEVNEEEEILVSTVNSCSTFLSLSSSFFLHFRNRDTSVGTEIILRDTRNHERNQDS